MVQEAVNELQSISPETDNWSPNINLGFPINISDNYINDTNQRLSFIEKYQILKAWMNLKN